MTFNGELEMHWTYKNTCCMCCGIPQVSGKYFSNNGRAVRATVDHILLRSLGGTSGIDNLAVMCYDCNHLRGNLFAEMQEFIDWYWSDEELPKQKNFSYLNENPSKKVPYYQRFSFGPASIVPPELPKQESKSEVVDIVVLKGVEYIQYKHPLFGNSLIKKENTL